VIHGLEKCASCHRGDARDHLDRLESGLARWFADDAPELSLAVPGKARSRPRRGTAEPATDRRRFLRLLGLQAGASVAERVAPATDDLADEPLDAAWAFAEAETLRKRPVPYHAVLARRIKRLPWSDNRSLPWHTRTIEEACSACMVCAENCPTGALEGSSDPGTRRISFDPAFCTNCSLCQQICPQDAIRPRRAQSATEAEDQRAVLMHRTTRQCDVCRSGFVPTDPATRLCPVCANEREMDEEWLAMLSD
jgi:ferredoxin